MLYTLAVGAHQLEIGGHDVGRAWIDIGFFGHFSVKRSAKFAIVFESDPDFCCSDTILCVFNVPRIESKHNTNPHHPGS